MGKLSNSKFGTLLAKSASEQLRRRTTAVHKELL
uniref:Transcriptional regulator n=1 Tax=Mesocestoides corti TaxID=53468 RepID=A0A5K3G2Y4_MESCO